MELSLHDAICRLPFAVFLQDVRGILLNGLGGIKPIVLRVQYDEGSRPAERVKASMHKAVQRYERVETIGEWISSRANSTRL